MIAFEILGGLRVLSPDGEHAVRGQFQRVLLQSLLIAEERVAPTELLMEELWGEHLPNGVVNALQAHVSRLRKWLRAIEPDRPEPRLVSHPHGYQLLLDGALLDAKDFVARVTEAAELRDHSPELAAASLRKALDLWRGPAFGGLPGGPKCACAATRYEEYRKQAVEYLFDAELRQGRHLAILGELQDTHQSDPLRESVCAQLMTALYRAGRQADALAVYQRTRRHLSEELGIDPTRDLQQLEYAILSQAPALSLAQSPPASFAAPDALSPSGGPAAPAGPTATGRASLPPAAPPAAPGARGSRPVTTTPAGHPALHSPRLRVRPRQAG
ncbi:AfsR/SARP family transcriptional regulator [Streptomyces jumonjinensis]|uniref:AfsR/SARP family transcriptional regulator n=1 Tax=Streptomyces jumonjinensis TaxID=1945 RepID=UPI002B219D48|nr:AfsR/SARP family transcriptional regulator [Streptomyces jumonjinensis]